LGATFFFFPVSILIESDEELIFSHHRWNMCFFSHFFLYRFIFLFEKISHKCRNENIL
jgi:hypothetical protein